MGCDFELYPKLKEKTYLIAEISDELDKESLFELLKQSNSKVLHFLRYSGLGQPIYTPKVISLENEKEMHKLEQDLIHWYSERDKYKNI